MLVVLLIVFWISNVFGLSITEETLFVEMRIWCIKIHTVHYLLCYHWVDASAGGLLVPEGIHKPSFV